MIYLRVVVRWETKAYALLAFLRHKPAGAREQGSEASNTGGGSILG